MCIRLTIILCFATSGRSSFNITESGHAGSSFTKGAPIPAKVNEILGVVGFFSRVFDSTGGFSNGKSEGNAKQ